MIAKDGLEYDIDNLHGEPKRSDEVEIIQYMRPDGKRRRMLAPLDAYIAAKADNLIIECEELGNGKLSFTGRKVGEPVENEFCEICFNGPGPNGSIEGLIRLIKRILDR